MKSVAIGSKREQQRRNVVARACGLEALEDRTLMSTYYVATSGSSTAAGTLAAPLQTVQQAINKAAAGDTIILRGGTYSGAVLVNKANLTIKSYDGETAKIANSYTNSALETSLRLTEDASGTKLENLDVSGGYYYALKLDSLWDTGAPVEYGASNVTITNCKFHDTGRDVIKITPNCNYVTITGSEIYNSGLRDSSNAEGIDGVQANHFTIRDSYIHNTTTNGIYLKGGSVATLIERCRVANTGDSGILLGQQADENWFDTKANPNYYESIDGIVRNNIVWNTGGAGIGAWAALRPTISNNTLYNVSTASMFGGLLIQSQEHWVPADVYVPSTDVTMQNNIVVMAANSTRPALAIRTDGLTGSLTMNNNLYYQPGKSVQIWDDVHGYQGGLAGWKALGYDAGSIEADPKLDTANLYHLTSSSPAINAGKTLSVVTSDYDKEARPAGGAYDIGADEFNGTVTTPTDPTPTDPTPTDPTPTDPTPTDPTPTDPTPTPTSAWTNKAYTAPSSNYSVEFDATPSQLGSDIVFGLSSGSASSVTGLAAIVRFNSNNTIDARNGGAYAADTSVAYVAGKSYHFKLNVNMTTKTYDVYVTPAGGAAVKIASGYAFRTEQAGVTGLNNLASFNEVGSATLSGLTATAIATTPTPPTAVIGNGNGLTGQYYENANLTTLKATRVEKQVNFNWTTSKPTGISGADTFSVRWSGQVMPKFSEAITFETVTDDGVRLWINGQLVINNWTNGTGTRTNKATVTLEAGKRYDIKMEYYENTGNASAKLYWSSAHVARELIPQSQLFSSASAGTTTGGTTGGSTGGIITSAPSTTTDIAAGKTATSSSNESTSLIAANVVDGDRTTRWASGNASTAWVQVDLGATYAITGVNINWEYAYAKGYQIQTSIDGTNWTTIYTTSTGAGGQEKLSGLSGTGRYVRINCTTAGTAYNYSIWDLQVFAK